MVNILKLNLQQEEKKDMLNGKLNNNTRKTLNKQQKCHNLTNIMYQ